MFVGWIRGKTFLKELDELEKKIVIDKNLVYKTYSLNPELTYGVYDNKELVAIISAYEFENQMLINGFYYLDIVKSDIIEKLVELFMKNIYNFDKTILFMAKIKDELTIFEKFGFKKYADFSKAIYSGGAVFNFSNATSKSINKQNYQTIQNKLDNHIFKTNKQEYFKNLLYKQSSLMLSSDFAYQHSYALSKSIIKISPWVNNSTNYDDAEKLLRGVIYHRGLKTLIAIIPSQIDEITNLYKKYNFELKERYTLMYKNEKPYMELEAVYGF